MQYLCAPMEGVTGDLFRQAQRQTFPAADSYYTPFLSPTANRTFSPRELREIDPAHNAGIHVVPQLMGHCAEDFLWMAGRLADMGYDEVNFNLGCPSNTVTAKKKGDTMRTNCTPASRVFAVSSSSDKNNLTSGSANENTAAKNAATSSVEMTSSA